MDEHQIEEMHRVRCVGRRAELPCPLWARHFPCISQPGSTLTTTHILGIVMEASLRRRNQSLVHFQPFSLLKTVEASWKFQLSNHGLVFGDQLSSRSSSRVTSLKQKPLLSPRNLRDFQESWVRKIKDQDQLVRQKMLPVLFSLREL